jgi:hypothetical protein
MAARNNRRACLGAIGVASLLGFETPSLAADWQINPRVDAGIHLDDNYHLTPENHTSVAGWLAELAVQFRALTPTTTFTITPAVHGLYFPNDHADNTTDPHLDLDLDHHTQRYDFDTRASYSKQTVVQSNRVTTITTGNDLGNPAVGDSGYVAVHERQQLLQVQPTLLLDLTQRQRLQILASYLDVRYGTTLPGAYVPFRDTGAAFGFIQDISPRDSLTARVTYAHYDPEGFSNTSDTTGLEGEWSRHLSAIQQIYVRVGADHTNYGPFAGGVTPSSTLTWVAGAGTSWAFQVTQIFVDITRTVDPNAVGTIVKRSQARARIVRDFTAKLSGYGGVLALQDDATSNAAAFDKRKYAIGTLGFRWRWRLEWALSAEYDYTWQKFASNPTSARSNAGIISIIYQPPVEDVAHPGTPLPPPPVQTP